LILIKAPPMTSRQAGVTKQEGDMPTDSIIIVSAVVAAFVFFAAVVSYADMTWSTARRRRPRTRD
jgi:uncharacterized RDD family membrane protein YckC